MSTGSGARRIQRLRDYFEGIYSEFNNKGYISTDPVEFPHKFSDPLDQEAVAILSAMLAYGNVKIIRRSIFEILQTIETSGAGSVSDFIKGIVRKEFPSDVFGEFKHRFNTGVDIFLLFSLIGCSWERFGSVGGHFSKFLERNDKHHGRALESLLRDWMLWIDGDGFGVSSELKSGELKSGISYFLTLPSKGSCCKRWVMFLRWMGRRDEIDLGLWANGGELASEFPAGSSCLVANQLLMPLDTHTGRLTRELGLTDSKNTSWRMVLEVTDSFAKINDADPIKYDFALARVGMLDFGHPTFAARSIAPEA